MKKYFLYIFSAIIAFTSCDDTTDTLGMSISEATEHLTIQVSADEFNVESHSVEAPKAVSRSASGYLGKIKDPETNSIITCNYMTQQRTMGTGFQFPELDSIYVKDFDTSKPRYDQILADSAELTIYFPSFFGDSLAQMTVIAHELKNAYQEKDVDKIYIDFDPDKEGKIRKDEGSIHSQVSFTYANHTKSDTELNSSAYVPYVTFSLNQPYTKDGVTYNNYGTYLMRKYFNPETSQYFNNQYDFVNKINPGFYIETLGGIGCMGKITSTRINVFFRGIDKGNPVDMYTVFAGTDEVMQKTQFTTTAEESKKNEMLTSNECTYIKTPAYIYTEITLPIEEILYCHEDDTLSTARVFVPRINDKAHSQYSLEIPNNLLLLPTDSVDNFFKSKKLADSRMYFLTTFDSKNNGYTYNNISDLIENIAKGNRDYIKGAHDYVNTKLLNAGIDMSLYTSKALPNQVKQYFKEYREMHKSPFLFTLVPVEATYSTVANTSTLTKITYDLSLKSTRLMKGTDTYLDASNNPVKSPITVSVIYSKFNE